MKVAVLGPKGTFCDKAFLEYSKIKDDITAQYYSTIDDVFYSDCEYGIVPIENTLDGYVQRTLDLLLDNDVCIIDENKIPVSFSLIANASKIDEINTLYVQFKANGQCRKFINTLKNVKICTTENNMESYYNIGVKYGAAAIVPKHIADLELEKADIVLYNESESVFQLQNRIVVSNVTDTDYNHTRFIIFKKCKVNLDNIHNTSLNNNQLHKNKSKVKIPVYIMPETDRPGILYELLKEFYDRQINLISIMSKPTRQQLGTYNFYIEIDGVFEKLDVIIETLKKINETNGVKVLGVYYE